MDLVSGRPLWLPSNSTETELLPLRADVETEVAVIGGGITGALVADRLTREGAKVVLLDRRDLASGSTRASTALLLYDLDLDLHELIGKIGHERAVRAYRACRAAIGQIERLIEDLQIDCGFSPRPSFYFASDDGDVETIIREHEARCANGFETTLLDNAQIRERFSFEAPAALWSDEAAQVDPVCLALALIARAALQGLRAYVHTEVARIEPIADGMLLTTANGYRVDARKVVFASGYEAQNHLRRKITELKSTYVIASEPVAKFPGWHERCLIWETARPYIYLRTTADNRIIIGGEDEDIFDPRARDALLPQKAELLARRFGTLFPEIEFRIANAWAGTFGETSDSLAYIGESDEMPNAYFALGYGGNGITFSMVAAEIIDDALLGRENADAEVFAFER